MKIDKELKGTFILDIEHCVGPSGMASKLKLATAAVNFEKKLFDFTTLPNKLFDFTTLPNDEQNRQQNSSCVLTSKSIRIQESCIVCVLYDERPL